jgi:AraC-like DNA-binding protein
LVQVDEHLPNGCRVKAWKPGVAGIAEVFHARIAHYSYPPHCHDTWTILVIDDGAIRYALDKRSCGAVGQTVAILPPGVIHDGAPAPGASAFRKRVLYLDQSVISSDLIGAAVDKNNLDDVQLRSALSSLHDSLFVNEDALDGESRLTIITERIVGHLAPRRQRHDRVESTVALRLRALLDEHVTTPITLDRAATLLDRTKPHLIRCFTSAFGLSPHAYVIGRRVAIARAMLLRGSTPAEAAAGAGFFDQAHLTRHFKRHTSATPARFAAGR